MTLATILASANVEYLSSINTSTTVYFHVLLLLTGSHFHLRQPLFTTTCSLLGTANEVALASSH